MGPRCVAGGCSNSVPKVGNSFFDWISLHTFPKDKSRRDAWKRFVCLRRPDFIPSKTSVLCSQHFTEDCFKNLTTCITKYRFGMKPPQLLLKDDATPTVILRQAPQETARDQRATKRVISTLIEDTECTNESHNAEAMMTEEEIDNEEGTEEEEEISDEESTDETADDPDWCPPSPPDNEKYSTLEEIEQRFHIGDPLMEGKVVVSINNLLPLLVRCPEHCGAKVEQISFKLHRAGAVLKAKLLCLKCETRWKWSSIGGEEYPSSAVNHMLMSTILFTGLQPSKAMQFMNSNNIIFPSMSTFFRDQQLWHQVVAEEWMKECEDNREDTKTQGPAELGGDGRFSSMGYCAQFGTYELLDLKSNKILALEVMSRVETENKSTNMELEGLKRCLAQLTDADVSIDRIVTDRHAGIRKFLEKKPIQQFFDVWHFVKGLTSKIKKLATAYPEELPKSQIKAITNRFYSMAKGTADDELYGQTMEEKRIGLLNHMIGKHQHDDNLIYTECLHPNKPYKRMDPEGDAFIKLSKILNGKQMKNDIKMLSPKGQTCRVESFHHTILSFAPKYLNYGYHAMWSRTLLAAMHYNENCKRKPLTISANEDQDVDEEELEEGRERVSVFYRKWRRGEASFKKKKPPPTYNYVQRLHQTLLTHLSGENETELPPLPPKPPTMTSQLENRVPPQEAIAQYRKKQRFNTY